MKSKIYKTCFIAGTFIFFSISLGIITFGQEQDKADIQQEYRERLRGADGVFLNVEVIAQDESDKESLTEDLQKEVGNLLKNSKIKVLTKQESDNMRSRPRLGVNLITFKEPSQKNVFLYSFRIVHFEVASLERNKRYVEGICWDSGLYIGMDREAAIKNTIREHIGKYIKDYLTVNPSAGGYR